MGDPILFYWSRHPGRFLDKITGVPAIGATFTGTVREWYETLVEVMYDMTLTAVRDNGGDPLTHCSWRADSIIHTICECSVLYKPDLGREPPVGTIGASSSGVICNLPMRSDPNLYTKATIELVQYEGTPSERVIGRIIVKDARILND